MTDLMAIVMSHVEYPELMNWWVIDWLIACAHKSRISLSNSLRSDLLSGIFARCVVKLKRPPNCYFYVLIL